jgi:hypothetical protein
MPDPTRRSSRMPPEGCTYSDRRLTSGFPLAPFGWSGTPATIPMMADGSVLRSGGEPWGPVSPDNVHETGVGPGSQMAGPPNRWSGAESEFSHPTGAGRANSKKDLVTGPIRGHVPCRQQDPPLARPVPRGLQRLRLGAPMDDRPVPVAQHLGGRRRREHRGGAARGPLKRQAVAMG